MPKADTGRCVQVVPKPDTELIHCCHTYIYGHIQSFTCVGAREKGAHALAGEAGKQVEPEEREGVDDVLVKEVHDDERHALVRPAPVHQQQRLQEAELRARVVWGWG